MLIAAAETVSRGRGVAAQSQVLQIKSEAFFSPFFNQSLTSKGGANLRAREALHS